MFAPGLSIRQHTTYRCTQDVLLPSVRGGRTDTSGRPEFVGWKSAILACRYIDPTIIAPHPRWVASERPRVLDRRMNTNWAWHCSAAGSGMLSRRLHRSEGKNTNSTGKISRKICADKGGAGSKDEMGQSYYLICQCKCPRA